MTVTMEDAAAAGDGTLHGAIDHWQAEAEKLRAFAKAVMDVWPMGDLDGGDLQEIAVRHGMLKPETRHEPCGENCSCAEYADAQEWEGGVVCYRKTPLLMGSNPQVERRPSGRPLRTAG